MRHPAKCARRETFKETGIRIDRDEDLIEFSNSPVRIAAEGKERKAHICYYIADGRDGVRPQRLEPGKHSSWRYYPIRLLPRLVMAGMLHPISCQVDVLKVVKKEYKGKKQNAFKKWVERDREIEAKMRAGIYEFLDFIHDKEDGHLVF